MKTKEEILTTIEPRTVKGVWILNSWGDSVGNSGWQFLTEDYFKTKLINGTNAISYGWTLVYNATPSQIKGKNPNWFYDLILRFISIFKLSTPLTFSR